MPRRSAGLLCFRRDPDDGLEVLLVHPGGPFWARRDDGAWSIPKGAVGEHEDPLEAARREFQEELGAPPPDRAMTPLQPARQSGGKLVQAWACEADLDVSAVASNHFSLEWPPRSGRMQTFPEVDRAEWFSIETARRKILPAQTVFLDQLVVMAAA
jgi:predicted NUDIX family NTP pyrophosphohydrolase